MNSSFFFMLPPYILSIIIFCLIILSNSLGYRYKKRYIRKHPGEVEEKLGSIEGAILGVMSLLLGFTFSVALSKFETRRQHVVEETNVLTTAILRCDMYPDSIRNPLRADFKEYIELRIAYYNVGENEDAIESEIKKAEKISMRIWNRVSRYADHPNFRVSSQLMLPTLNEMIDIVNTRDSLRVSKVPSLILWTLLILVLIAAFLLGSDYRGKKRNKKLAIGYALVMTLALNLITELNKPRTGFINLHVVEHKMTELRELVK